MKYNFTSIQTDKNNEIRWIKLNNPLKYNKISKLLITELEIVFDHCIDEKDLKAVIIYGDDKVFSAGGDLKEIADADTKEAELLCLRVQSVFRKLHSIPVPVICCLKGIVFGGGLELALHCDVRFADQTTMLKMPETDLGLIPGAGGITLLSKYLGPADTFYYLSTGIEIPLQKAVHKGLLQEIIEDEDVVEYGIDFAKKLAAKPREALTAIKSVLYTALYSGTFAGLEAEIKEFSSVVQLCGKKKIEMFFNDKKNKNE
ncbi:MAG: enoyl-CoA hydratase/isomerase family protein [Bacteroidales bacterium]